MEKRKEYRAVKRYYRDPNTFEVKSEYVIQYLGVNILKSIFFFGKWLVWKDLMVENYDPVGGVFVDPVSFDTEKEAKKCLKNLRSFVYADEVVQDER